ncbi:MAG: hypothetical protein SVR94_02130 [Pseudomonadota bacterium]|nr:hypothetical protein [Pseudomonadota bacterium]
MLTIAEQERKALENIASGKSKRKAIRAKIVLWFFVKGKDINTISQELETTPQTVQLWQQRWRDRLEEPEVSKRLANMSHTQKITEELLKRKQDLELKKVNFITRDEVFDV